MEIQNLVRVFKYNSVQLADPSAAFTLVQVRDFYANTYPEIISAEIEGPEIVGNKTVYTFRRAVGTKGIDPKEHGLFAACPPAPPPPVRKPYERRAKAIDGAVASITGLTEEMRRFSNQFATAGQQLQEHFVKKLGAIPAYTGSMINVPVSHCPIVPIEKIIDDLLQLERIGWFSAGPSRRHGQTIRVASKTIVLGGVIDSAAAAELRMLHKIHCSREIAEP